MGRAGRVLVLVRGRRVLVGKVRLATALLALVLAGSRLGILAPHQAELAFGREVLLKLIRVRFHAVNDDGVLALRPIPARILGRGEVVGLLSPVRRAQPGQQRVALAEGARISEGVVQKHEGVRVPGGALALLAGVDLQKPGDVFTGMRAAAPGLGRSQGRRGGGRLLLFLVVKGAPVAWWDVCLGQVLLLGETVGRGLAGCARRRPVPGS